MKKLLVVIVCCWGCFCAEGRAQVNLVPNGSFEHIDTCYFPFPNCSGGVYYGKVPPWYDPSPNGGNADLYDSCSNQTGCQVPSNFAGYQYAHNGNNYVGEECFDMSNPNIREYIQAPLDSILKPQHKYCVTFYVSLANVSGLACNNIGMYFSDTSINIVGGGVYPYLPQIIDTSIISDTAHWTLISGEYIALGGEQYITIGNFNTNATTSTSFMNSTNTESYYLIDDVSVVDCTPGLDVSEQTTTNNLQLFPNPATKEITITITSNQPLKTIHIYNVLGMEIMNYKLEIINGGITIDVSGFANGIYTIEAVTAKGVLRQKLVKE